jgi:hypothetical protein
MILSSSTPCSENRKHVHHGEPTIAEILTDPIVRAVMAADGVDANMLRAQLGRIARNLANSGS